VGRIVHFEIHCDDLDRAERFYNDVFGWTIARWDDSPIDYRLITTGTVAYFKDSEGNIFAALEPA
jgi:predicted enzyme related to lactoylglutathione lyase